MPDFVVRRVAEALNSVGKPVRGSRVGILGVAYKRDVDDPRESPAFRLMERLHQLGADLSYNDPHIPRLPKMRHYNTLDLDSQPLTPAYLCTRDCVLIVTTRSFCLRLGGRRGPRAAGCRHAQRHRQCVRRPRQDLEGVTAKSTACTDPHKQSIIERPQEGVLSVIHAMEGRVTRTFFVESVDDGSRISYHRRQCLYHFSSVFSDELTGSRPPGQLGRPI